MNFLSVLTKFFLYIEHVFCDYVEEIISSQKKKRQMHHSTGIHQSQLDLQNLKYLMVFVEKHFNLALKTCLHE